MRKIMTFVEPEKLFGMRLVSKNWLRSLKDPYFVRCHNDECIAEGRKRQLLICRYGPKMAQTWSLLTVSTNLCNLEHWKKIITHPSSSHRNLMEFVGTFDGIICLQRIFPSKDRMFIISNPLIGQYIDTSQPLTIPKKGANQFNVYIALQLLLYGIILLINLIIGFIHYIEGIVRVGFAYIAHQSTYAVIIMWKASKSSEQSYVLYYYTRLKVWSDPIPVQYDIIRLHTKNVYLDGCIYWITYTANQGEEVRLKLAVYNIQSNNFEFAELPAHRLGCYMDLLIIDGRLAVASIHDVEDGKSYFNVWIKLGNSEYSYDWLSHAFVGPQIYNCDFIGTHGGSIIFSHPIVKFVDDVQRCFRKIIYMRGNERVYTRIIYGTGSRIFVIDRMIDYQQSLIIF